MDQLPLSIPFWVAGALPLFALLFTLLQLRWKAVHSGMLAWVLALILGFWLYEASLEILMFSSLKGLSLTLFIVSIIWTSVFCYNLVERLGALPVISRKVKSRFGDPLMVFILLSWCVSAVLQGVAGFGVPVAIVTPLLVGLGFPAVQAAVGALVGHAWSISFGSMGASYFAIQLITGLPASSLGMWMGIMLAPPTLLSGLAVAHIYGGWRAVRQSWRYITGASVVMSALLVLVPWLGAPQLGTVIAAGAGSVVLTLWAKRPQAQPVQVTDDGENSMSLGQALLPYAILFVLTLLSQLEPVRTAVQGWALGFHFPGRTTGLGYLIAAQRNYAAIRLLAHPAPLLIISIAAAYLYYRSQNMSRWDDVRVIMRTTRKQCMPTTLSIAAMLMMALVMNDAGMTTVLARGVATASGSLYPLLAPVVGVLGCFMTGSNTSSNVLFGMFQMETALSLGLSTQIMAAAQSAGGALGSSIAPAKVLVGTASAKLMGKESVVFRMALPYALIITGVLGIVTWLFVTWLFPSLL